MGTVCVVHCIVAVQADNRNNSLVLKPLCMSWIGHASPSVMSPAAPFRQSFLQQATLQTKAS